ncbi:MAG: siphovirus Gp157 family protein [Gracilimonas sp.]|uniref:siphovirus Gp157 family protein n=1 Tax=Gracilimonas sp. TaxID=1974203 RepID=UPI0019CC3C4E|nr:siphovirus Gp157 family protein [Gracilimonas sp.]MBD3617445.1 siphovirus Gp157 family protein [Gracilimonas sp.]
MNTTQPETPTTKESLFDIGEHFYALETLLIETEGEITEEIDQWLKEYEGKEEDKVDAYCYIIRKFEEIADEAQRLAERSQGYRKKVSSLKERLKLYLEYRCKEKVETSRFTVTVCGNGGLLPVKLHEDVSTESLPEQFIRVFKEPDMSRIREALLDGDEQAHLFAKIEPRGTHLRIK